MKFTKPQIPPVRINLRLIFKLNKQSAQFVTKKSTKPPQTNNPRYIHGRRPMHWLLHRGDATRSRCWRGPSPRDMVMPRCRGVVFVLYLGCLYLSLCQIYISRSEMFLLRVICLAAMFISLVTK